MWGIEILRSIPTDFGDYFIEEINEGNRINTMSFIAKSYKNDNDMKEWFPELKKAFESQEPADELIKLMFNKLKSFNFSIKSKTDSKCIIGYIQIYLEPNINFSMCYLDKEFRNKHIMTNILRGVTSHLKDNNMYICANINPKNIHSKKLFENLGFKLKNGNTGLYELYPYY